MRRKLQFRLRKLLLWTTVVAVSLGVVGGLGTDPALVGALALALALLGLVRLAFGPMVAAFLSLVGGSAAFVFAATKLPWKDLKELLLWGCVSGWLAFVFVETAFRTVEWADWLIGSRTDE